MEEFFINEDHKIRFMHFALRELEFKDFKDAYWRSFFFIISGNEALFSVRDTLVDFDQVSIRSEYWFNGTFSGGEERLLGLAYNLFNNNDYYEFDDGTRYNISPLEVLV